ncbi:uncharacterized protein LOC135399794 isoform X1 [Ornithodoros turicata]|uniref:uncharacterized protein LOC135399794 isoform X1 n=1 Tax=Ornithodoros turicata TaxID=34597 RepID=UPI003138AA02
MCRVLWNEAHPNQRLKTRNHRKPFSRRAKSPIVTSKFHRHSYRNHASAVKQGSTVCQSDEECNSRAYGEVCLKPSDQPRGFCGCPPWRPVRAVSRSDVFCFPGRQIFQSCVLTAQCQESNPYLTCSVGVCACLPPRVLKLRTKCVARVNVGNTCEESDECVQEFATCTDRICSCMQGYKEVDKRTCIKIGLSSWKRALMFAVPAGLSLMLLLLLLWLFRSSRWRSEKVGVERISLLYVPTSAATERQDAAQESGQTCMETAVELLPSVSRTDLSHVYNSSYIGKIDTQATTSSVNAREEQESFQRPTLSNEQLYDRYPHLRKVSFEQRLFNRANIYGRPPRKISFLDDVPPEEQSSVIHQLGRLLDMPVRCRILVEKRTRTPTPTSRSKNTRGPSYIIDL